MSDDMKHDIKPSVAPRASKVAVMQDSGSPGMIPELGTRSVWDELNQAGGQNEILRRAYCCISAIHPKDMLLSLMHARAEFVPSTIDAVNVSFLTIAEVSRDEASAWHLVSTLGLKKEMALKVALRVLRHLSIPSSVLFEQPRTFATIGMRHKQHFSITGTTFRINYQRSCIRTCLFIIAASRSTFSSPTQCMLPYVLRQSEDL
eukprot:360076-Chlamydomonas_euryale.AAC.4